MADETPSGTGMSKRILGMPMWLVVVGGAAAVSGIYFLWRKHQSSSTPTSTSTTGSGTTTDTTGNEGLSTDQYESLLALLRDIQENQSNEESPEPPPSGTPTGGKPPIQGGNPPRGPEPPVKISPTPAPKPPTSQKRSVTVGKWPAWNSTLWGIAGKEYGQSNNANVNKIYSANEDVIIGNEIRHGMSRTTAQQRKWLYPGESLVIP